MIPETNHDTEISIYLDFLEDQGIIVDRTPEDQDQWIYESKNCSIGSDDFGEDVGGVGSFVGVIVGVGGFSGGVGGGCDGVSMSKRIGG